MVTEEKTYKELQSDLKNFLAKKRKLTDLAKRVGVDVRTVHYAFNVNSSEELTGKKLDVIKEAKIMKKEIESNSDPLNETLR